MTRLLVFCGWLALAAFAWFGFAAAYEWWQQPMPDLVPADTPAPAPVPADSGAPAGCPWRYPTGPCALGGEGQ